MGQESDKAAETNQKRLFVEDMRGRPEADGHHTDLLEVGDVLEGTGTHKVSIEIVEFINPRPPSIIQRSARCRLLRSGKMKLIQLATLKSSYRRVGYMRGGVAGPCVADGALPDSVVEIVVGDVLRRKGTAGIRVHVLGFEAQKGRPPAARCRSLRNGSIRPIQLKTLRESYTRIERRRVESTSASSYARPMAVPNTAADIARAMRKDLASLDKDVSPARAAMILRWYAERVELLADSEKTKEDGRIISAARSVKDEMWRDIQRYVGTGWTGDPIRTLRESLKGGPVDD